MPTLDWIGKSAVVNHHREVPYRLLEDDPALSVGEPGSGNLLVEGDNLEALKALLPYYAGQVKCIYIDPPYNTGNEGWAYNDNVNAPEIRKWLHKVVGGEAEDLSRHDKWLCMMYPRLTLLRQFLREDGVIFVSIDDNEAHHLTALMNEIFLPANQLAALVWDLGTGTTAGHFIRSHEYILAYARQKECVPNFAYLGPEETIAERATKRWSKANPPSEIHFPAGIEIDGLAEAEFERAMGIPAEPIEIVAGFRGTRKAVFRDGRLAHPATLRAGWAVRDQILSWIDGRPTVDSKGQTVRRFFFDKNGLLKYEKVRGTVNPRTVLSKVASTKNGTAEIEQIMGTRAFGFPKPTALIKFLVGLLCPGDELILDSFAGSGTTGHAVLDLNREDGGSRRFILVELEESIAQSVTRERLRRVIEGYTHRKASGAEEAVPGLGGGFRYCRLGDTLFTADGKINPAVTFADLARHIFFVETGEPLSGEGGEPSPLVGVSRGVAYYLLYNGILKDKSANGGNVLTSAVLASLPPHDGPKVIYGTSCRLGSERLRRAGVTFKQIPYEIKVD